MSQLKNSMYQDTPAIVRDVTASQFAAQRVNAPDQPGVIYRVDGALYSWNGSAWVGQVTATTDPATVGFLFGAQRSRTN